VGVLAIGLSLGVWAQCRLAMGIESKAIDPNEAVDKIREAKIINPKCSVAVSVTGKEEATVLIQRDPRASDEDCKIDAILVSRTLMDRYPSQLMRVKSVFAVGGGGTGQATVTAGDIRAFKSGQLDKKALLESIELVKVNPLPPLAAGSLANREPLPAVVGGPFETQRQRILQHINTLAALGVNTKSFRDQFDEIEKTMVTSELRETGKKLSSLNNELAEQDDLTRQARRPFFRMPGFGPRRRAMVAWNERVQERLKELASQGKDISPYTEQLTEIERLKGDRRVQEANRKMNELSHTLGI
jgi:hypothetical protein